MTVDKNREEEAIRLSDRACQLHEDGKYHESITEFSRLQAEYSDVYDSWYTNMWFGLNYRLLNEHQTAIEYLLKAYERKDQIEEDFRVGEILLWLGETYLQVQSFDRAEYFLRECIAYLDTFLERGSWYFIFHYRRTFGKCCMELGKTDEALRSFEQAEALLPKLDCSPGSKVDYVSLVNLDFVQLYINLNDGENLSKHLERVRPERLHESYLIYYYFASLYCCAVLTKRYDEAIAYFKKAERLGIPDIYKGLSHFSVATAYFATGNPRKAREYAEKAGALFTPKEADWKKENDRLLDELRRAGF